MSFNLTITNLDTSETTREVVVEENYLFDTGSRRCALETFKIEVATVNPAGSSQPAEVSVTLPPLLDLSSVMDSLEYSLTGNSPGIVQLNVSFQVSSHVELSTVAIFTVSVQNDNPCPNSPVNYTLLLEVLEEFEANATSNEYEPSISNSLVTFLVDLEADTKYQFYIEAMNGISSNSLEPIPIGMCIFKSIPLKANFISETTDVQGVSLCQLNETSFSIMCTFLTGSTAHGCFYTLVSTSNDGSVSGRIERGNSSEGTADLSNYDEVILLAWDRDGTNGTTPVRLDINFTTCPTSTCKCIAAYLM